MSLNLALRFVLDALKKNPSSKMFLFGLAALDKFKRRLKDLQSFCNSIANIPHFQQFPSLLRQVSFKPYLPVLFRFAIFKFWGKINLCANVNYS